MHPDRESIAEDYRVKYESGDVLALFWCLDLWRCEGQGFATAPTWAIEAWIGIGAEWFREYVEAVESDAEDWLAKELAKPKAERTTKPETPIKQTVKARTLEQVAGIKQARKKSTAWQRGRDGTIAAYVDKLRADAEAGRREKFEGVDILNKRGEMTKMCMNAVAKAFGRGQGGFSDRTLKRTLKRAQSEK